MGIPVNLDRLIKALDLTRESNPRNIPAFSLTLATAHRMNDLRANGVEYHPALKQAVEIECGQDAPEDSKDVLRTALGHYGQLMRAASERTKTSPQDNADKVSAKGPHVNARPKKSSPSERFVVTKKDVDTVIIIYKGVLRRFFIDSSGKMQCENYGGPQLSDEDFSDVAKCAATILLEEQERLDTTRSAAFNYLSDATVAARIANALNDTDSLTARLEEKFPDILETQPWRQFRILSLARKMHSRAAA